MALLLYFVRFVHGYMKSSPNFAISLVPSFPHMKSGNSPLTSCKKIRKILIAVSEKTALPTNHKEININKTDLRARYMRPEVNSNRFEISLLGKISLRCEVTSLSAFT